MTTTEEINLRFKAIKILEVVREKEIWIELNEGDKEQLSKEIIEKRLEVERIDRMLV